MRFKSAGALPDRCVVCNAAASGARVRRRLYCSPLAWRLGAFAAPFVVFGLGVVLDFELFIFAFWPLALALFVVNFFVRKSLRVDLGICARHRRMRTAMHLVSAAAMAAVVVALYSWRPGDPGMPLLWPALAALLALAAIQPFMDVNAIRLKAVTDEDAWLGGTGRAFREALPELPG